MGCGCKKNQSEAAPQPQTPVQPQPHAQNVTVQESVKKIVEKYYKNK
jgi:hypothetical protein